eukprot:g3563.t1 g3563   contig12:2326556-2328220(+)
MAKSSARRRATSNNSNGTANCCSNNSGGRRNNRMAKALPLLLLSQLSTSGVDAVPSSLRRRRAAESHHRRSGEKSESPPFYPAHSQPQHHRTLQTTVHNYCGIDWTTANSQCGTPCPSGESTFCPAGETCFGDLAECPGLIVEDMVAPPQPASLTGGAVGGDGNNGVAADAAAVGGGGGGSSSYVPPSIPSHCTTTPNVNTNGVIESYNGVLEEYGFYQEFNSLKQQGNTNGPALKTLIAIGGWNFDQTLFTNVASTPEKRTTFANSVVDFLVTHGFDGLDLDWEYPVSRQGSTQDYENYVLLVQAIRTAFKSSPSTTTGEEFLLTMAIPSNPEKLQAGYNLPSIASHIDWFHLMSYDIYGSWDTEAGSNSDMPYIEMTVDYILSSGVDPSQLVLGMASYGRSALLSDSTCTTAGCPISGGAITGCSGELGFIPTFELQEHYVNGEQYDTLLYNEITGSMEMVVSEGTGGGGGKVFS